MKNECLSLRWLSQLFYKRMSLSLSSNIFLFLVSLGLSMHQNQTTYMAVWWGTWGVIKYYHTCTHFFVKHGCKSLHKATNESQGALEPQIELSTHNMMLLSTPTELCLLPCTWMHLPVSTLFPRSRQIPSSVHTLWISLLCMFALVASEDETSGCAAVCKIQETNQDWIKGPETTRKTWLILPAARKRVISWLTKTLHQYLTMWTAVIWFKLLKEEPGLETEAAIKVFFKEEQLGIVYGVLIIMELNLAKLWTMLFSCGCRFLRLIPQTQILGFYASVPLSLFFESSNLHLYLYFFSLLKCH